MPSPRPDGSWPPRLQSQTNPLLHGFICLTFAGAPLPTCWYHFPSSAFSPYPTPRPRNRPPHSPFVSLRLSSTSGPHNGENPAFIVLVPSRSGYRRAPSRLYTVPMCVKIEERDPRKECRWSRLFREDCIYGVLVGLGLSVCHTKQLSAMRGWRYRRSSVFP